jgi:katanin p60 ATPase-containing subunit A1
VKDWSVAYFRANGNAQYQYKMDNDEQMDIPEDERVVEMEYAGMDGEERKFVPMIMSDVVSKTAQSIDFSDIVGLEGAKALLNETVVWPLILPQLFTGIREPWRGVLLFGPPGTGKTLLAKAVAGQNGSTFFNCSTATLVSKFRGESEKIVRCLFCLAKHHSPSVVFLDEVDALVGTRGAEGEHEASRRFKTELFVQIDGIVAGGSIEEPCLVTVLAASNNPWDLDEAMRRRLEKRIFVGIPDESVRKQMFTKHVESMGMAGGEGVDSRLMDILADRTEGYSGADIELVCREAKMKCMRRLLENIDVEELVDATGEEGGGGGGEASVTDEDLVQALEGVKRTVRNVDEYEKWERKYGCRP